MDPQPKHNLIIGAAVACAALLVIVLLLWWLWPRGPHHAPASSAGNNSANAGMANLSFSTSSYQIALARAISWQSDAALTTMTSDDATGELWTFVFVSPQAKGQALAVMTNGQTIESANVIAFSGSGAVLPENIIAPDQAMVSAHAVPGYASASIVSAQLVYDAAAKQWYWGMKTSSGETISIKAAP